MTRSKWKDSFFQYNLLSKIEKAKKNKEFKPIKTWARNSTIIESLRGNSIYLHNGNRFTPITITYDMIGHKLGEFSNTRKPCVYKKKTKKKK